jgi:hypothetical protein
MLTAHLAFTDAIGAIASGLRDEGHSHAHLNHAASRIDHLGRQLHGLGFARDLEIAACFTAALADLHSSHHLPEVGRASTVGSAIDRLEAALTHADAGFLPPAAS